MIKMVDFTSYEQKFERTYGGASCRKYDIQYQGERWFLKFPGNIREQVPDISYSNSSVSEYIGSHVYDILGIDVHETILGIYGNKCVVACKDFVDDDEFPVTGFGEFKTTFVPGFCDSKGNETNGNGTDLMEIIQTLDEHPVLVRFPELKERFWDMFAIDALIGNNDRNNGNWGLIRNRYGRYRMCPVFDNGSSYLPKTSEAKMKKIIDDAAMLNNAIYSGYSCILELKGHRINPLKYIENSDNPDCLAAVSRLVERMDMASIEKMINEIPEKFKGIDILSNTAKELYMRLMTGRYERVFIPVYERKIVKSRESLYNNMEISKKPSR